ncbi:response regulator transcription factor [Oceanobacillus sp. CAU 1775]
MDKILLINDEKIALDEVEECLTKDCFHCERVKNLDLALETIERKKFSLIIIDVPLNKSNGWSFCEKLRNYTDAPLIVVSTCANTDCIVRGFELGADDYIVRPFVEEVLLARIKAVLRRTKSSGEVEIDGLSWNKDYFNLNYKNISIKLTPIEFNLLGHFIQNINQVFSREQLIDLIWGSTSVTDTRTVDSHVQNIRQKVKRAGFPIDNYLKTIWGIGYQWVKTF